MKKNILVLVLLFILSSGIFGQTDKSETSSTLMLSSSTISITIGGAFLVNGTFPALPTERVDQFVTRIFMEAKKDALKNKDEYQNTAEVIKKIDNYARRNIKLKRVTGEEFSLDLEKFRITGDFVNNPYLKSDDVLIFPDIDNSRNYISVFGAVNNPVTFQFVDGDKLSDAIAFSRGINPAYENVNTIQIIRLSYDGNKEHTFVYKLSENPSLQRGDRIFVLADETQKKDFRIYIAGEVNRPGFIPITKNNTQLIDVIKKAGGIKETADLNRAELIRGANVFKSILFTQEFEALLMQRMSNITSEDSLSFSVDNKLRFSRGNGTIDFNKLSDTSSTESKFILRDGDYVFIPEKINLVYVFGQVNVPGYVQYVQGEDYQYYINKAGGIGQTAKGDVYLIKGKTRSWIQVNEDNKSSVEAGDYLWLPKENPRTFQWYLDRVLTVSSVVGTLATILLLITQLTK
ncbi:MAG: SLBB domain-containing protein [Ignavibacteriales bacterium]|nr:SLBB domain-containing protein [Ignavibacteriales bacterium]